MLNKAQLEECLLDLPEEFTIDELFDRLSLIEKIKTGAAQSENNEVLTEEQLVQVTLQSEYVSKLHFKTQVKKIRKRVEKSHSHAGKKVQEILFIKCRVDNNCSPFIKRFKPKTDIDMNDPFQEQVSS